MIAFAVTLTFVQEQALLLLPNVQLTVVLMFVFVSVFTYKESVIYILSYVLLDNLYLGGFSPFNVIPMLVAWNLIPLVYHTVLKRTTDEKTLAIAAFLFGFVYSWSFIPGAILMYGLSGVWEFYLLADIPFEIILAVSGSLSVLWLYQPLYRVVSQLERSTSLRPQKSRT
jgi:hypothetical protein